MKIAEDNIRDRDELDPDDDLIAILGLEDDLAVHTIGVRHGRLRDLIYAYIILGENGLWYYYHHRYI